MGAPMSKRTEYITQKRMQMPPDAARGLDISYSLRSISMVDLARIADDRFATGT